MNKRIFVEKKPRFQTEANDLLTQLKNNLALNVLSCRVINTYDVFNINEAVLSKALNTLNLHSLAAVSIVTFLF